MVHEPPPDDDPVAIVAPARIDVPRRQHRDLPGPRRLVATSVELLRRSAPEVRSGALAVGLQFLGLVGPLLVLVAVAVERLPDPSVLFGETQQAAPADAALASLLGLGILVALGGTTALAIESRAIGLAIVGARAVSRPVGVGAALRRSRQTFWRLLALSAAVELPIGIVGSLVGEAIAGLVGARGSAGAAGLLAAVVLQAPLAFAAAGIVVGDLGLRATLARSIRLVVDAPRTALVVIAVGGAAQVLLILALNGGLEVVAFLADLADLGLGPDDPARTFATLVVLLGASSAAGSLLFSVTCLAVAPQAVVGALGGPIRGLERAADEAGPGPSRWLSLPMALGIATAVVVSIVGIQNVLGRT
jgi:hypothetical protein